MKMEVLSVQNQFQGQFGVLGSAKVKDWTSPLTPPPPSHSLSNNNNTNTKNNNHHNHHHNHHHSPDDTLSSDLVATNLSSDVVSSSLTSQQQQQNDAAVNALSLRLQNELRAAKSRHLACTEVLLPADLLQRIAAEIIRVSEKEPCGIRGCSVFIEFEDEPSNTRRIASFKVDPNTVSTFELYLTLKHNRSGWTSLLPQFLKNLARSSTIMISHEFILTKNKLYHTFSE